MQEANKGRMDPFDSDLQRRQIQLHIHIYDKWKKQGERKIEREIHTD
jgi:hypothetical protein